MIMGFPQGWAWLATGLVLVVLEVLAPGAFLVWIGLAAICTGLVTLWLVLSFSAEVVAFAAFAAVAITVGLVLRRSIRPNQVNTPDSGLVGRRAMALSFDGQEGRVRLGDSDWPARLVATASVMPKFETPLEVVGVDGLVLLVRPLADGTGLRS